MTVSAIVLAGGRSSRFGSPKLAAQLDGRSLLERAITAVAPLADETIVVLRPEGTAAGLPSGVRIVRDPEAFGGPLVGLGAGLAALGPAAQHALVVGGDMPRLQAAVLEAMLAAFEARAADPDSAAGAAANAVVLADAAGSRPLPLVIRVAPGTAAVAAALSAGERSLRALLERLAVHVLPEAEWRLIDPAGDTLIDVDRPDDLAVLQNREDR